LYYNAAYTSILNSTSQYPIIFIHHCLVIL